MSRRRERAQAVIETALVIPIMLILTFGFIGLMIEVKATSEYRLALNMAAEASLRAPRGDMAQSRQLAAFAFDHTLNPYGSESNMLHVVDPVNCSGDYYAGIESSQPVTCTANVQLDFSRSVIGFVWQSSVTMHATGIARPSEHRRCVQYLSGDGPTC